jgi:hypothetical protein
MLEKINTRNSSMPPPSTSSMSREDDDKIYVNQGKDKVARKLGGGRPPVP